MINVQWTSVQQRSEIADTLHLVEMIAILEHTQFVIIKKQ